MGQQFRGRVIGIIMLLVGVTGIIISLSGIFIGRRLIDNIGRGIDEVLVLSSASLNNVQDTLLVTKDTVGRVSAGMNTVEGTAVNLSQTLSQTRPLLSQLSAVATEDVPGSLETIQSAMPAVTEAAATIDQTLTTLNDFRIDESILGIPIQYDLGIDYEPEVPFDESVAEVGDSLDGVPERLRGLKIYLNVADNNLGTVSRDLLSISRDLDDIDQSVSDIAPLIDEYIRIVEESDALITQIRAGVQRDLVMARWFVTITMIWIGLAQVAPLYIGWGLLQGRELFDETLERAGA